jgi:hypothetical protein
MTPVKWWTNGHHLAVAFYDFAGRRLGKVEVPGMVQMEVIEAARPI